MNRIERLLQNYDHFMSITPWVNNVAGAQRVWFAVYDKSDERRLRLRIQDFEIVTKKHEKHWIQIDLSDFFATWMSSLKHREDYFESPEDLDGRLINSFPEELAKHVNSFLLADNIDQNTLVALYGIGGLFGFTRVSRLMKDVQNNIKGRLLVFFPGVYENNTYKLFDARDGWNYLAIPITAQEGSLPA